MTAKKINNNRPVIAVIGRPNVGKSTLFNKILNKNVAIVDDMPGVTRDLNYQELVYDDKPFTLVDTGGFYIDETGDDLISKGVVKQIGEVVAQVDGILFVCDGKAGLTESDKEIYRLLRVKNLRSWLAVSKIDSENFEIAIAEFYETGAEIVYPVSGKTGYGVFDLLDDMTKDFLSEEEIDKNLSEERDEIKIAVFGRPNVGKSTLINKILGREKMLVSPIPGTTRDPINSFAKHRGKSLKIIDTAGIRRKKRVETITEKAAILRAFHAVDESDIVIFMMDASELATDQDLRILALAHEKGKGIVVAVNKWDLVEKETGTYEKIVRDLRDKIKFAPYAPIISISALNNLRVSKLLDKIVEIYENYLKIIDDETLENWLALCLKKNPPPLTRKNRLNRFNGIKMERGRPPTLIVKVSSPQAVHFSYARYLSNQFYDSFSYEGVPVKFIYKRGYEKSKK